MNKLHPQTETFRVLDLTSELSLRERLAKWIEQCNKIEGQLIEAQADLKQIQQLRRGMATRE